jgi:hypothetical protein
MNDNKIESMTGYKDTESDIYPDSEFSENARKFRGFNWRGDERILSKENIFPDDELAIDAKVQIDAKQKAIESEKPMEIQKETLEYDEKNPKPKDKTVKKL